MLIAGIIGPPASGKTTLLTGLAPLGPIFRLRTGVNPCELVDESGRPKPWLAPDVVQGAFTRAVKRAHCRSERILMCDNFPGNEDQVDLLVMAGATVIVKLTAQRWEIFDRADRRRVCHDCESDPLHEPRTAAASSVKQPGTCAVCGSVLRRRRGDERVALQQRVNRYQVNLVGIEHRCLQLDVEIRSFDTGRGAAVTREVVRNYLMATGGRP
jgi:adenylate kinase family enzyme